MVHLLKVYMDLIIMEIQLTYSNGPWGITETSNFDGNEHCIHFNSATQYICVMIIHVQTFIHHYVYEESKHVCLYIYIFSDILILISIYFNRDTNNITNKHRYI